MRLRGQPPFFIDFFTKMRYYDKCITLAMITRRMPVLDMTVIYDLAIVALRILMPVYAIIIVYQCYAAMRRQIGRAHV